MELYNSTHKQADYLSKGISTLLELSAVDDLVSFKHAIEQDGQNIDESGLWYGRKLGSSNKMGFEERTPLMVAAMFGSIEVVNYILETGSVDPNRACGSDGATALHCAAASGSCRSYEVVKLLIDASADINSLDTDGNRPCDVVSKWPKSLPKTLKVILNGESPIDPEVVGEAEENSNGKQPPDYKKEYPVDPSLPDMKDGIYITDEFRMYVFKVRPCSRAYSHDWTECPFVHPGENARRRDPSKYHYSCVPCPDFRKGSCTKADGCEFSHGIFESWLHPAQYRTRMCKDEPVCARKICFFAHGPEELRSTSYADSAVASPRSMSSIGSPALSPSNWGLRAMWQNQPPSLQLNTGAKLRDAGLEAELRDLENQRRRRQLLEELASLSPPEGNGHSMMNSHTPPYSSYSPRFSSSPSAATQSPRSRPIAFSLPTRSSPTMRPSRLSDWGSPPADADRSSGFSFLGEELGKLRNSTVSPDVSWVHSIIKDTPANNAAEPGFDEDLTERKQFCLDHGDSEVIPSWLEQQWMVA